MSAGFGEASPEAKAAKNLHNFFTYVAVRIVTAQLQVPLFPSPCFYILCLAFTSFCILLHTVNYMLNCLDELNLPLPPLA